MEATEMARALFWVVAAALLVGGLYFCFWRERPYVLIRFTAARAIEATAEFQHKTKLFFEIGQEEGAIPGACHNFEFSLDKVSIFKHYLATGAMQFSPYGNQSPPFPPVSEGSLTLADKDFLVDTIDACQTRKVTATTGAYELTLGKAVVIEVTGIRKQANRAFVDFKWQFESLNQIGQVLPEINFVRQAQVSDPRTTAEDKSIAPFWIGSAELTDYDDGWRVTGVKPSVLGIYPWDYGPDWPDENFNWHAFDEQENRWIKGGNPE